MVCFRYVIVNTLLKGGKDNDDDDDDSNNSSSNKRKWNLKKMSVTSNNRGNWKHLRLFYTYAITNSLYYYYYY